MSQRKNKSRVITLPKRGYDSSSSESLSDTSSDESHNTATMNRAMIANHIDLFNANRCQMELDEAQVQRDNVHIRVQQRRANSYITTAAGLSSRLDHKAILRALKHTLHCNGSITKDPEHGDIIQLSGDQREHIKSFLIDEGICEKNQIITHGF